jgi:hypothetical protein
VCRKGTTRVYWTYVQGLARGSAQHPTHQKRFARKLRGKLEERGAMHNKLMAEHHGSMQFFDRLVSLRFGTHLSITEN